MATVLKKTLQSKIPEDSFVCQLTKTQILKMKAILQAKGFVFSEAKYAFYKAEGSDIKITVYLKGKLVLYGAGTKAFVEGLLEPDILGIPGTKVGEKDNKTFRNRIGVDEDGKTDYFGPLVIVSLYVDEPIAQELEKLDIFKVMNGNTPSKLFEVNEKIRELCKYSIVTIGPERYNELYEKMGDMNRLLAWGHSRAIENILFKVDCDNVIVNQFGDKSLIIDALMKKGKTIRLQQQQDAEKDIAVAAANVIAKAEYLQRMEALSKEFKMVLLRGTTSKVEDMARELIDQEGISVLVKATKLHFRTTKRVILS